MKFKLEVRYTSGSSYKSEIDPDNPEEVIEAMTSTDFESLTLARVRHPAELANIIGSLSHRFDDPLDGC